MRDQQNNTSSLVAVPSNAPMNAQNVPMWLIILGIANRCPPYSKNLRCQEFPHTCPHEVCGLERSQIRYTIP